MARTAGQNGLRVAAGEQRLRARPEERKGVQRRGGLPVAHLLAEGKH